MACCFLLCHSLFGRQAMLDVAAQSKIKSSNLKDISRHGAARDGAQTPSLEQQIEFIRQESERGEAQEYVFGSDLLEQHHSDLLRGLKIPRQLSGFVNTQSPLLVNLALGGPGSGVFFHRHDAALNAVFYGTKRWMFYPDVPTARTGGADKAHYRVTRQTNSRLTLSEDCCVHKCFLTLVDIACCPVNTYRWRPG